jgi:hypothetical protein
MTPEVGWLINPKRGIKAQVQDHLPPAASHFRAKTQQKQRSIARIPVVVNGPVGRPFPRPADGTPNTGVLSVCCGALKPTSGYVASSTGAREARNPSEAIFLRNG